jgi:hypothetical protein
MIFRIAAALLFVTLASTTILAKQSGELPPKPGDDKAAPTAPATPAPVLPAACCGYRTVEHTVMQPVFVHTTRKVQTVEYREEPRQRTIRFKKPVYETKMVDREITVLVREQRMRTESYTVCKPVLKKDNCGCCVTEYVHEQKTCAVPYVVCVPTKKNISVPITTCRYVPEDRTINYVACVPVNVERDVDLCVCRMVPKKVMLQVPACPPVCCGGCY